MIEALKKAAEAAKPGGNSWYDADWLDRQGVMTLDAEMITHLDPATVLELCRLAEIGQQTLDRLDKQAERIKGSRVRGGMIDY